MGRWLLAVAALIASVSAWAGGDGLGPGGVPWSAAGSGPAGWLPTRPDARIGASAVLEYVRRPVVRVFDSGGTTEVEPLLGDAVALRIAGAWSPTRRVALGLSVPTVLGATGTVGGGGPALGTAELAGAVVVVPPTSGGLTVTAAPWVTVPLGPATRWLRDHAPGGGVAAGAAFARGPVTVGLAVGPEWRSVRAENLQPGVTVRGEGTVAIGVSDRVDLLGAVRVRGVRGELPAEAGVGIRWRASERTTGFGAVARGVVAGLGAPALRVTAGAAWVRGWDPPAAEPEPEPEPELRRPLLVVRDPAGEPVAAATVAVDGEEVGRTDAAGRWPMRSVRPGRSVTVGKPGYVASEVVRRGREDAAVVLGWADLPVELEIVDRYGVPVAARVTMTAEGEEPRTAVAEDGLARLAVPPGTWEALIEADGYAAQRRAMVAPPGRWAPLTARVLLAPEAPEGPAAEVSIAVTDATGAPLEGVEVLVDGVPVGTTGTGGALDLTGLALGPHRVEVAGDRFEPFVLEDVELAEGANDLGLALRRKPGGLRLVVRSPEGPVTDAVARLIGPSRLPAYPLGADGERMFQLRPGEWTIVVTSAEYGVQSTVVRVDPEATALAEVEVLLRKPEGGEAQLEVLVADPDGRLLAGADVLLDGERIGTTASGGRIAVEGLVAGLRRLEIRGERYEPVVTDLFLVAGRNEERVTVAWTDGAVSVRARTPTAEVSDGVARFSGSTPVAPVPLDAAGVGFTTLDPGPWTVVVTSPSHGLAQKPLVVPDGSGTLTVADVVFRGGDVGDADLTVTVSDPAGAAVAGAVVRLDGVLAGTTDTSGVLVLDGIRDGERELSAARELYLPGSRRITLREGDNAASLQLGWAPGAVRVVAEGPDGPVPDAVVRFVGPRQVPPMRLGEAGERAIALEPGTWQGLASSPRYGLAQATIAIDDAPRGVRTLRFDFTPTARGTAELLVRVVDPRGAPLEGAAVEVAGQPARVTGPAGAVLVQNLEPGLTTVSLNADLHFPRELRDVELRPGTQERVIVLRPVPGTVVATVVDEQGTPLAGELRFLGPDDIEPQPFAEGRAEVDLPPGMWRVLAASPGYAARSVDLEILPGAREWPIAFTLEPAQLELTDDGVVIGEAVLFEVGRAELRDDATAVLDEMATFLLADPSLLVIEVQGHTDATGSVSLNYALSRDRARAVVAELVARGVPPERLVARGYGPTRPIADNDTPEGRARNRRVQFVIRE